MIEGWLGGAAVVGLLAACWQRVKMLSWRLANLLVVRVRVEGQGGQAVAHLCWTEFKRSPFGERRYRGETEYVQPVNRYQLVGYEQIGWDAAIFWRGWRPLLLGIANPMNNGESNVHGMGATTITFLRGTFDGERLLVEALDKLNAYKHREQKADGSTSSRFSVRKVYGRGSRRNSTWVGEGTSKESPNSPAVSDSDPYDRRYLKWRREEIGMPRKAESPFGILCYPPEVLAAVEQVRRWLRSEAWYKEKEIPWRYGIQLCGPPGTGKSALTCALGRYLNLPIVALDLASFDNRGFEEEWGRLLSDVPCIALFEDIDTVFHGRDNVLGEEGGGLTFDCLLNCVGGAKDASGVLVVVTTNRPELLDEALGRYDAAKGVASRPGRIDLIVELNALGPAERRLLVERILSDCPDEIEAVYARCDGMTGAQVVDVCRNVALERFWQGQAEPPPSPPRPNGLAQTYDALLQRQARLRQKKAEEQRAALSWINETTGG